MPARAAATLVRNSVALAVCVMLAVGAPTEALAKGGGHGGGHISHSSSHSSHSSMSRSYSPSRASSSSASKSSGHIRSARSGSGGSSSRSGRSGSRNRSGRSRSSSGSSSRSTYQSSGGYPPPPPSTVVIDNGPTVVYREPRVRYASDEAFWDGVVAGRVEALTVAALGSYLYSVLKDGSAAKWRGGSDELDTDPGGERVDFERELAETKQLMQQLAKELQAAPEPLASAIERPADGTYRGASAEDDGGDQDVLTRLRFARDGTVAGSGHDGVDGAYEIREGRWAGRRVAWIERYNAGFTVALRGQVRPDGTILALWASSTGVGGSVELAPP